MVHICAACLEAQILIQVTARPFCQQGLRDVVRIETYPGLGQTSFSQGPSIRELGIISHNFQTPEGSRYTSDEFNSHAATRGAVIYVPVDYNSYLTCTTYQDCKGLLRRLVLVPLGLDAVQNS